MFKFFEIFNSLDETVVYFLVILLVFVFNFVWILEYDGFSLWSVYDLEDDVEENESPKKEKPGFEELITEYIKFKCNNSFS